MGSLQRILSRKETRFNLLFNEHLLVAGMKIQCKREGWKQGNTERATIPQGEMTAAVEVRSGQIWDILCKANRSD
jgi:hypothetical protein